MTLAKHSNCVLVKPWEQYLEKVKNECFPEDTEFGNKVTWHCQSTLFFTVL